MLKVLQINAVDEIGSTGTIMSDIQDVCTHNGIECHIAYSFTRRHKSDITNGYHIGNWFDHKLHALLSRLFREQAYFSTIPTWFFLRYIDRLQPDVVHLHNLHANYININMLLQHIVKRNISTVVTLHDSWFLTGGCCHPELDHCLRWQSGCKGCPLDKRGYNRFLFNTSQKILRDRKKYFNAIPQLYIVGVSEWMSENAHKSILSSASISTIRNGVRTDVFCPMPYDARRRVREKYGIKESDFVILAPASKWLNPHNIYGLKVIIDSLKNDEKLVLYGCSTSQLSQIPSNPKVLKIKYICDKVLLSTIYSMADVFINCTHMDTCSFINIEAQACGTPVITFDNTGARETVNNISSFRVKTDNYHDIVDKIAQVRKQPTINTTAWISDNFTMQRNYNLYIQLYHEIHNKRKYS